MDGRKRRVWHWLAISCGLLLLAGAVVGSRSGPKLGVNKQGVSQQGVSQQGVNSAKDSAGSSSSYGAAASTTMPSPQSLNSTVGAAQGAADTAAPAPASSGTGSVGAPLPPMGQQKIVKNATLSLEVKKGGFRQAFDSAATVASGHGGYVVSSESSVQKGQTSIGTIVLRVPADAFDAVRAELVGLGSVKDEHLSGEDVSGQLVDLDARIRSLQAQEDAIRALMAKARTVGETIEIQNQLTAVRQQIEQLSGERARLDNAASLSTITVHLAEPGAAVQEPAPKPKPAPSALRHSLTLAAHGAETVVAGTIIVLGWAVPLGLVALVAWALWRLGRRVRPVTP